MSVMNAMVLLAMHAVDRIEQLEAGEMLVRLAQALLEEARVAAEGGHPVTHDLQRQARELIGAALDRCAVGRSS